MPLAITQDQIGAPPSILRRKPWTRRDVRAVEATGAFNGLRYELINGQLINVMGMTPRHAYFLHMIGGVLREQLGWRFVRMRSPVEVDVNKRRIIVHRSPSQGEYQSLTVYSDTEPVSPLAAPQASVRLADLGG